MFAYLDPGSGSMIAQAVVAGVAGAAVVGKVGWKRMTGPFRKKGAGESPEEASTDEASTAEASVEEPVVEDQH